MALRNPQRPDLVDTTVPWLFTDDHRAWRQSVRDFCDAVVRPTAAERSNTDTFDPGLAARLGEMGFYGIMVPEEYGGSEGDLASFCIVIEELARVDSSAAVTVHVQSANAARISQLGSDAQREELLPAMVKGDVFICGALTEPSGGSDSGNISTRARLEDGHWVINGAKQFITNSGTPNTRYISVLCRTGDSENGRPEVSLILVPADAEGVEIAPSYQKMGWRGSDTHPVFLNDVRVPAANVLGGRGSGHRETLRLLTWARIAIAAMATGLAQGCLEATRKFVTERESFGQPLYEHQVVAHELAEIAVMTHTARTLTYDACWKYDHQQDYAQEAAMSKLVASELANKVAYKATQLHGGYGFMDEYDVSRHYRDARVLTIGEGTSEMQRLIIARSLGFPG
jgi:short-chain 2-methylacyl-CoA dehydrogenase